MMSLPEGLARALVVYHLAEQRALMGAFLDALGIAHENGLIQDDGVKPDPASWRPRSPTSAASFQRTPWPFTWTRSFARIRKPGVG
jgi:hypothetical protein